MSIKVKLIYAISDTGVIGVGDGLPWRSPTDLRNFKELTIGHCVVMGKRTFDGLPRRSKPLPSRDTVVLTSNLVDRAAVSEPMDGWDHVWSARSVDDAIRRAEMLGRSEIWFCGGVGVIKAALPYAVEAYVTHVEGFTTESEDVVTLDYRIEADTSWVTSELALMFKDGPHSFQLMRYNR